MNPEIKAKVIEAARSGAYEQTTGALREGDKFCFLGLIYEVTSGKWKTCKDCFNPHLIPEIDVDELCKNIGLTYDCRDKIVSLNDGEKKSFSEIADWLEHSKC